MKDSELNIEFPGFMTPEILQDVKSALEKIYTETDSKIAAIKQCRFYLNLGLKDAKDFVEHYISTPGLREKMASDLRLREAAPDLLTALQAMVETAAKVIAEGNSLFDFGEEHGGSIDMARAVIARATGETR